MNTYTNWLTKERGGAPNWLLLVAVLALIALGITAISGGSKDSPEARWTPPPGWEAAPAAPPDWPVAVFIGDSYTAGAGGNGAKWTTPVASSQEWQEVNLGRGGTGFVATSGPEGCGIDYCPSFPEMVPAAVEYQPSVVVVAGGRNDGTRDNLDAIRGTFESLREALPEARIFAVSPMWDDNAPYPATLTTMGEAIRAAVESVGGTYLEIGAPLEGRADLITDDGVHPNADGYVVLGDAVIAALERAEP